MRLGFPADFLHRPLPCRRANWACQGVLLVFRSSFRRGSGFVTVVGRQESAGVEFRPDRGRKARERSLQLSDFLEPIQEIVPQKARENCEFSRPDSWLEPS